MNNKTCHYLLLTIILFLIILTFCYGQNCTCPEITPGKSASPGMSLGVLKATSSANNSCSREISCEPNPPSSIANVSISFTAPGNVYIMEDIGKLETKFECVKGKYKFSSFANISNVVTCQWLLPVTNSTSTTPKPFSGSTAKNDPTTIAPVATTSQTSPKIGVHKLIVFTIILQAYTLI